MKMGALLTFTTHQAQPPPPPAVIVDGNSHGGVGGVTLKPAAPERAPDCCGSEWRLRNDLMLPSQYFMILVCLGLKGEKPQPSVQDPLD